MSVTIDHKGSVICQRVETSTQVCYKWRSTLACKDCPMQKLIVKSPQNLARFR